MAVACATAWLLGASSVGHAGQAPPRWETAAATRDLGFMPRTPIDEGIPRFVAWFRDYHGL